MLDNYATIFRGVGFTHIVGIIKKVSLSFPFLRFSSTLLGMVQLLIIGESMGQKVGYLYERKRIWRIYKNAA